MAQITVEQEVSVKCALRKRCENQRLFNQIQKDVRELSTLGLEASRLIHYSLMKNCAAGNFTKIDFRQHFFALCQTGANTQNVCRATLNEYLELRGHPDLYDIKSYRINIVNTMEKQYKTVFHNNIWMHAESRLKKFFRTLRVVQTMDDGSEVTIPFTNREINPTIKHLFWKNSRAIPNQILLNAMTEYLNWNGERLFDIKYKSKYFNHFYLYYNLQRYNETHCFENFKLIPQYKFGCMHIQYDTQSMFLLLKNLKLIRPKDFDITEEEKVKSKSWFRDTMQQNLRLRDEMWKKFFKPPETQNKKFKHSIKTDSVAISFFMMMKRQKPAENQCGDENLQDDDDEEQKRVSGDLKWVEEMRRSGLFDAYIGIDPGHRLIAGGVRYSEHNQWDRELIKIKNKRYHHMSGYPQRLRKLYKWTTKERNPETIPSSMSGNYVAYAEYQLRILSQKQREFCQRKVVRLKLKKYICVKKAVIAVAKEIIGDNQRPLIVIGSTLTAANSPIKGYRRTPERKQIAELRERADVLLVDEFRTTKLCASCHLVHHTSQSPHRYQFCPNCRITWNRDVNGAQNILYIALCIIDGEPIHPNYLRTTHYTNLIHAI